MPHDLIFRRFAFQAGSLHAVEDLVESVDVICQSGYRHDHVVHEILVLLRYPGQILSQQSLKVRRGLAQAKGHPVPQEQTQFTCKCSLLSVLITQRNLPEGRTQIQCSENFFRDALVYAWNWVSVLYGHRVQVTIMVTASLHSDVLQKLV